MIGPMLAEAWAAMRANRTRTLLTMLGMIIGVGAVVIMTAIGQGAQYQVDASIASMGSNLFIVLSVLDHRRRCALRHRRGAYLDHGRRGSNR